MKTVLLFIVVVLFAVSVAGQAPNNSADLPGGIVASNNSDVFCYTFKDASRTNVTSGFKTHNFSNYAFSRDGKIVVWIDLLGNLNVGRTDTLEEQVTQMDKIELVGMKNLNISPDGSNFSWEREFTDSACVLIPPDSPMFDQLSQSWVKLKMANSPTGLSDSSWPLYLEKRDVFYGTVVRRFSANTIQLQLRSQVFGGNAIYIPTPKARILNSNSANGMMQSSRGEPILALFGYSSTPLYHGASLSVEQAIYLRSVKRCAGCATWNKKLFAIMVNDGKTWTVEIRKLDSHPLGFKTDYFFIPTSIPVTSKCLCLAFMPNESLTCLYGDGVVNNVLLLSHTDIQKGMSAGRTVATTEHGAGRMLKSRNNTVDIFTNNIFRCDEKTVLTGTDAMKICWPTDHDMIYRSKDGGLYRMREGIKDPEKILKFIPETWFYVEKDAPGVSKPAELVEKADKADGTGTRSPGLQAMIRANPNRDETEYTEIKTGSATTVEVSRMAPGLNPMMNIRSFILFWHGSKKDSILLDIKKGQMYRPAGAPDLGECFDYCIVKANSLDEIKNPTDYEFKKLDPPKHCIPLDVAKSIAVLRYNHACAAIRPIEIVFKGTGKNSKPHTLKYEWKFWPYVEWPGAPVRGNLVRNENQ